MLKYLETLTDDLNKNKSSFVMNSKIHYAQNELQIQCIAYGCKVRDLLIKKT
jgi:hypothetical protein